MKTAHPLDDRVVIETLEAESQSAGGIILPDVAKAKPQTGKVIACGPGRLLDSGKRAAMTVKVGSEVLFSRFAGNDFDLHGKPFKIMREEDVLAVLK